MEMETGGKLFFDLFVAMCNHMVGSHPFPLLYMYPKEYYSVPMLTILRFAFRTTLPPPNHLSLANLVLDLYPTPVKYHPIPPTALLATHSLLSTISLLKFLVGSI